MSVADGRARAWTHSTGAPGLPGPFLQLSHARRRRRHTTPPPPSRSLALDPSARALPFSAPPTTARFLFPPWWHCEFVAVPPGGRVARARSAAALLTPVAAPWRGVRACRSLSGLYGLLGKRRRSGGGGRPPLPLARARWLGSRVLGRPAARAFLFTHTESARARAARPPPRAAWP